MSGLVTLKRGRDVMRLFCIKKMLLMVFAVSSLAAAAASAAESGSPNLSEPSQKEKFFKPDRLSLTDTTDSVKPVLAPHFAVSHDMREENISLGIKQTSEKVFGEAGGKLNLLGDISLTSFAKIPVYSKETVGSQMTTDGVSSSGLFPVKGKLSWRSELGVPLEKGLELNFFYDNSTFGKVDRPGVEEREERFGTRFIFKFK